MMAAAHISVARSLTGGASSPWYDCATCTPEMRVQMGHDAPPTYLWRTNLLDETRTLTECPRRTLLRAAEESPALVREMTRVRDVDVPNVRAGRLPYSGGYREQPARLMAYVRQAERIAALGEAAANPDLAAEGGA